MGSAARMNPPEPGCGPLPPLRGELVEWIALRRVCGGGVAMIGGRYFDGGRRVPCYLPDTLDGLARAGLIALADIDAWGLRRVAPTRDGRTRYRELSALRHTPSTPTRPPRYR